MIFAIGFALVLAVVTSAANVSVVVGANDQLVFDPLSVKAQSGDIIQFEL
jgi:plastocyanin